MSPRLLGGPPLAVARSTLTATTTTPRRARIVHDRLAHDLALGPVTAGADEAGRGCLAGPIVAAAVSFDWSRLDEDARAELAVLDDSKRLSARKREDLLERIHTHALEVVVHIAHPVEIDERGIHEVNLDLLRQCLADLDTAPTHAFVDGFSLGPEAPPHRGIVGGDGRSVSVAAASIVAKTSRDRYMRDVLDRLWPGYGFAEHAGYATSAHQRAIRVLGVTPAHRCSFNSKAFRGLPLPRS